MVATAFGGGAPREGSPRRTGCGSLAGFIKTPDQRLEKDPDRRVQDAVQLVFAKFMELGCRSSGLVMASGTRPGTAGYQPAG